MATLLEMTAEIVKAHAGASQMTSDQILEDLTKVYAALQALESGQPLEGGGEAEPALSMKQSFKKNEVVCLICGKGGMKTLARHLAQVHNLKPGAYRKQFGIPSGQSLTARNFSESRRKMALERGLADNLAKAREVRAAKLKAKQSPSAKAAPKAKPAPKAKAAPKAAKTVKAKATPKAKA